MLRAICLILGFFAGAPGAAAQNPPLPAGVIMARVAAKQDSSDRLHADYIYHQRIHVTSRKTNRKLMCEETIDFLVIPHARNTKRELQSMTGRYWHKGRYVDFHQKLEENQRSVDCEVAGSLGTGLTDDHSKDGFDNDLFPLTSKQQKTYQFQYLGEEELDGRRVYRVSFKPKDKADYDWAGEADIDESEYEPVDVFTRLSRQLPLPVRTLLVSLPGLGFNVQYQLQPDGVWFPSTFGTEFRLRLFMLYRRVYTISLENSGFQRTHVASKIHYATPALKPH